MKISLLHYSSQPIVGGVESVLAHHAHLMTNAGHEVTILTGRGENYDKSIPVRVLPRLDSRHAEVTQVKSVLDIGKLTPAFDTLRDKIKWELVEELSRCDILIAHNVASLHKNLALTAALYELNGTPDFPRIILWHHDLAWTTARYHDELHDGYPWDLLRKNWQAVTQVVVSKLRQQELAKLYGISEDSIHVVPNGVDINAFFKFEPQTVKLIESLDLLDVDPLFLLPVRLTPRKNIELALLVMAEVKKKLPGAGLLVTGPEGPHNPANVAYKEKLIKLRNELGLQGSAHFLAETTSEFMPDQVIADFYRLADALLFPSREEGFGIPIIEAAFSHLPVFCADIPVLHELGGNDLSYFDPDEQPIKVAHQIMERLQNETTSRWARHAKRGYMWNQIYTSRIAPLIVEGER